MIREAIQLEKQTPYAGGWVYRGYEWYKQSRQTLAPWQWATRYGLFARMTTKRIELVIEASEDGTQWHAYPFLYKPNQASDIPEWSGFHMPRLDWQMWFEAMQPQCRVNWFLDFLEALLQKKPDVFDLLQQNHWEPALENPRWIRVRKVRFKAGHQGLWQEKDLDMYCPAVTLQELRQARRR